MNSKILRRNRHISTIWFNFSVLLISLTTLLFNIDSGFSISCFSFQLAFYSILGQVLCMRSNYCELFFWGGIIKKTPKCFCPHSTSVIACAEQNLYFYIYFYINFLSLKIHKYKQVFCLFRWSQQLCSFTDYLRSGQFL